MLELVTQYFSAMLANEGGILLAFLFLVILYLLYEKKELKSSLAEQRTVMTETNKTYNKTITDIILKYQQGQYDLQKSLIEIRTVLTSMERRI